MADGCKDACGKDLWMAVCKVDEQGLWFANWLDQPVVERENIGGGSWSRDNV